MLTSKISKLKLTALLIGLALVMYCSWAQTLDSVAMKQVDAGIKNASISFGTARAIGAVISVAQSIDLGVGVKIGIGQALQPIGDLVAKFGDLMFAATVAFGVMKVLLTIGGSKGLSLVVTVTLLGWIGLYLHGSPSPVWLSKLVIILLLARFAVPIVMCGSNAVFQKYMADDYKKNETALATMPDRLYADLRGLVFVNNDGGILNGLKLPSIQNIQDTIKSMVQKGSEAVDQMIKTIVVFLLQTLVIPLLLFWALWRVLIAMFQNLEYVNPRKTGEKTSLEVQSIGTRSLSEL